MFMNIMIIMNQFEYVKNGPMAYQTKVQLSSPLTVAWHREGPPTAPQLPRGEHLADIGHSRPRPVALHFHTTHHNWQGKRVRGLWLMCKDNSCERKEMETRLIDELGTPKP